MDLRKVVAPLLIAGLLGTGTVPAASATENTGAVVSSHGSTASAPVQDTAPALSKDENADADQEKEPGLTEKDTTAAAEDESEAEEKTSEDEEEKDSADQEDKELTEEEKALITPEENGNVEGSSDENDVPETYGNKYTPYLNESGQYTGAVVDWADVPENSKRRALKAAAEKMLGWGYSQSRRMEFGWRDCSSFVYTALADAGLAPQTSWAWTTYDLPAYTDLVEQISWDQMQPGDIVLGDGHVAFYWGKDADGNAITLESCGGFGVTYGYLMCNGWNFPYTSVWRVKGIDEGTAWAQTAQPAPAPQPQPEPQPEPAPVQETVKEPEKVEVTPTPEMFRTLINIEVMPRSVRMDYQDWDQHQQEDH